MIVLALLTGTSAMAQVNSADSMVTLMDGIVVPLVNKDYVTPDFFIDNWYVGLYGGVNTTFGSDAGKVSFGSRTAAAAAITIGKEISPVSDLRMHIAYTKNIGVTDDQFNNRAKQLFEQTGDPMWMQDFSHLNHNTFSFNTWALSFDYMPNFTNILLGFRENRKFYLRGLLGIGGSVSNGYKNKEYGVFYDNEHGQQLSNHDKYDDRQHSLVNIRAGLTGTVLLSRNFTVHFEGITNFADNSFDSNPQTNNTWDCHFDFLAGISYHFKGKGGRQAGFYYARNDLEFYKRRIKAIDDLRDRTAKRVQEVQEMAPDTVDVNAHVIYTLIAFDEGSDVIDRLQQSNIYTTAYAWLKDQRTNIYITNSSAKDDPLFRKRADAVGKVLMERYEIPGERVLFCPDEKVIRPRGNYIVVIVND